MLSPAWSDPKSPGRRLVDGFLFIGLPLIVAVPFLVDAYHQGILGFDFESFMLPAAREVVAGHSPYPAYEYPPLVAFALVPFTFLPGPNIIFVLILIACVPASLWFLGVRDWRCYGLVFLWPPVLAALQTANVTIPLLLGAAICWHSRAHWRTVAIAGGLTIAAKLLTAPLLVWLAVTRRFAAAFGVAAVAAVVSAVLWSAIGFSGAVDYPTNMGKIAKTSVLESYTLKVSLEDIGLSPGPARIGWALLAMAVVVGAAVLGWRGDDKRSFALAVAAMIFAIPIVWMHSFALLIAVVAVLRPRLSVAWVVPLLFVVGSGTGNGDPWQTAGVLGAAVLTVVLALVPPRRKSDLPARGPLDLSIGGAAPDGVDRGAAVPR